MVDDAVRHDDIKAVLTTDGLFGVAQLQSNAFSQPGCFDIAPRQLKHVLCGVDCDYVNQLHAAAQFDGNLRGASAEVEDFQAGRTILTGLAQRFEQVADEVPIHLAVVHRIVSVGLFGRIHQFGLEYAVQHGLMAKRIESCYNTTGRWSPYSNGMNSSMDEQQGVSGTASLALAARWRPLEKIDRRVAGVLVEKAKTTPEQYPLTVNSLVNGCNQKNNRDPQMQLEEADVMESLDRLKSTGAVAEVQGSGRVPKFRHLLYEWLGVDKVELAVMGELLLRGAN